MDRSYGYGFLDAGCGLYVMDGYGFWVVGQAIFGNKKKQKSRAKMKAVV